MTNTLSRLPRVSFHFTNPSSATYGYPQTTGTLTDAGASLRLRAFGEQQKIDADARPDLPRGIVLITPPAVCVCELASFVSARVAFIVCWNWVQLHFPKDRFQDSNQRTFRIVFTRLMSTCSCSARRTVDPMSATDSFEGSCTARDCSGPRFCDHATLAYFRLQQSSLKCEGSASAQNTLRANQKG